MFTHQLLGFAIARAVLIDRLLRRKVYPLAHDRVNKTASANVNRDVRMMNRGASNKSAHTGTDTSSDTCTDAGYDGRIDRLAIVGFGLIGASLAAALKRNGFAGEIVAVVRSEASADEAMTSGLADRAVIGTAAGVAGADVVMLCVPMLAMREALEAIAPVLDDGAIVTDAGSVKGRFVSDARAVFGSLERIVPGHPIAGREKSGMAAADATLYAGRRVLLTPVPETEAAAVRKVTGLWELAGATVECLTPDHHDRVLAATSHLPHVLAFALVDTLATQQSAEEIFRYAAGGFRDFTRIASSDPVMWRDVCLTNREALLDSIAALESHLDELRDAVERGDGRTIEATFRRARAARDSQER